MSIKLTIIFYLIKRYPCKNIRMLLKRCKKEISIFHIMFINHASTIMRPFAYKCKCNDSVFNAIIH